jgi:CHAD domain-containing protein
MISHRRPSPQKWIRPPLQADSTAAVAFVANVRAAAAQIHANGRGASISGDPEYLHQLRVGMRRLRSTLRAFRGLVRKRRARAFDRKLRSLLRSMGAVRDWDVFLRSHLPPAVRRAGLKQRALAHATLRAAIAPRRLGLLSERLLVWAQSEPWRAGAKPDEPLGRFGARALQLLLESVRDAAAGIDWTDAKRRHRVRIRAKRLRYGSDCFAAAFPAEAMDEFQQRLKKLQLVLGELNDIAVQRRLLNELARERASARATADARARLLAAERPLLKKIGKAWKKFDAHPRHWRREAARARG